MAVTTQRYTTTQFDPFISKRTETQYSAQTWSGLVIPIFMRALLGGLSQCLLLAVSFLPLPTFISSALVAPLILIWLTTGLLAVHWVKHQLTCTQKAGEVAWITGFWASTMLAIATMILAAGGYLLVNFGQSFAANFGSETVALWGMMLDHNTLALSGRIFGALLVYGVMGTLISALISAFGGMVWMKLCLLRSSGESV